MAETDKSFWGHLDDLRKVLFKMAGVLAVLWQASSILCRGFSTTS